MRRAAELVVVASAPTTRAKPQSACIVGALGVAIGEPVSTAAPRVTTQRAARDAAMAALADASSCCSSASVSVSDMAAAVSPLCPCGRSAEKRKTAWLPAVSVSCSDPASAAVGSGSVRGRE
eukprot:7387962-Prymnesium_polylepis.3